jgi:hypothetical protein
MKRKLTIVMIFLIAIPTVSALSLSAKASLVASELWRVPVLNNQMIDGKDTGDVNGDGIVDVAVLTYGGTLQIIKNDGTEIWSKSTGFAGGSPAISDVDEDGKGEVFILGRMGSTGAIRCYDDDGTELWQFTSYSTGILGYAAFLNLDSDSQLEVFVTATAGYGAASTSYALDTDGSVMWSYSTPELGNQMIYTDVTGDGVEEIILATFQRIYVLDKSGAQVIPPIVPHLENHGAYIMAGDITGDGVDDFAVSYHDFHNTIYVFRNDGAFLWKTEYGHGTYYNVSSPIVLDIDGDGVKEVVVYGGGAIRAYENDGTELWAWGNSAILPYYCWPAHFDVNRDMKEEIVFEKDSHVYALSLEGGLVMDFVLPNSGMFIVAGTGGRVEGRETPRWDEAADVNNDGFDELIIRESIDGQYFVAAILIHAQLTVTSLYGSPTPTSGTYTLGTSITASVTSPVAGPAGTQYVCTGWSGTGDVPASGTGTSVIFTITQDSSITWTWKTQYYLTVKTAPSGIGTIPGQGWYDQGQTVPLTAPINLGGYRLITIPFSWDVDGTSQGAANPITVTMNAPHTATAQYTNPSIGGEWAPTTLQALSPIGTLQLMAPWIILALVAAASAFVAYRRFLKKRW